MPGTVVESDFFRCKHHNLPFYVDTVAAVPGNAGVIQIAVCAKKLTLVDQQAQHNIQVVQQSQLFVPTHSRDGGRRWPLQVSPLYFLQGNP
jgi:hypothetical protein